METTIKSAAIKAKSISTELDQIIGAQGIFEQFEEIIENSESYAQKQTKTIDIGSIASIAGLIVGLIAFIQQINAGQVLRNRSREDIAEQLISKFLDHPDLTKPAKERIAKLSVEKFLEERHDT